MREPHCCSVSLIVVGADLDVDAVTAALGWPPDRSWRRGDRKQVTLPDGRQRIFDSIHDGGGAKYFLAEAQRALPLQEQFDIWLKRFRTRRVELGGLGRNGWRVELDCFVATTEVLQLPHEVLAELAALGIGVAASFSAEATELGVAPDCGAR
jgi:hypothetical protein